MLQGAIGIIEAEEASEQARKGEVGEGTIVNKMVGPNAPDLSCFAYFQKSEPFAGRLCCTWRPPSCLQLTVPP